MDRRSEALHTETMHRLLATFLPPGSSYHWAEGGEAINGVFLEAMDTICVDSYWQQYCGGSERKQLRRRITIRVSVEETELGPA